MSLTSDGKIDGKIPVFNDCLAFIWNKSCRCARDPIVKACVDNFSATLIVEARDLFFKVSPEKPGEKRRTKHRAAVDILNGLYAEMQSFPSDSDLIFVALNLNNIPSVDLTNIDGVALVQKQVKMSATINEILEQNVKIMKEIDSIRNALPCNQSAAGNARDAPPQTGGQSVDHNRPNSDHVDGNNANNSVHVQPNDQNHVTPRAPPAQSQNSFANTLHRNLGGRQHPQDRRPPQTNNAANGSSIGSQSRPSAEHRNEDFEIWDRNRRRKQNRDNLITGRKTGSELGAIPKVKKCAIFVSRLNPSLSVDKVNDFVRGIIGDETCTVEKLKTKFDSYASFYISCDGKFRDKILDPDMWESGVLVRPFYGSVASSSDRE